MINIAVEKGNQFKLLNKNQTISSKLNYNWKETKKYERAKSCRCCPVIFRYIYSYHPDFLTITFKT